MYLFILSVSGEEQIACPDDTYLFLSPAVVIAARESEKGGHKDQAYCTHPPHKSLCSQRILNTFAKIGAKVQKVWL